MIPSKKEIVLALLVVGFVWLALFARWVPVSVQSVLFVVVVLLAFAMIVGGWWRWRSVRRDGNIASWRKKMGLLGLVAATLALALPFIAFLWALASFNPMMRLPKINWLFVAPTWFFFALRLYLWCRRTPSNSVRNRHRWFDRGLIVIVDSDRTLKAACRNQ
jgi:hypothetical protein